jgi:hypothetical protein
MFNKLMQFFKKLDLKSLLIIGLVIVILLMRACSGGDKSKPKTVNVNGHTYEVINKKVDTVYIPKDTTIYKPGKIIYKDKPQYIPIPVNVDSLQIVKDYYSSIIYKDTLQLPDNIGYINIIDTIAKNRIAGRLWEAKLKQKTIYETTIVKEPAKTQLYVGGTVGFNSKSSINLIGPTLMLKTKLDRVYTLSAGYGVDRTLIFQGGLLWKIKLKK